MTSLKLSVDDPEFVDKIILEVKSHGHFDSFRKSCLADFDTQPAYQNLHTKIQDSVQKFLSRQVWVENTNKNRLREEMRHSIIRAGYLDSGVSRIVDQIVEQKMDYIQAKVEEILYEYVGIEKKKEKQENGALEVETDLLPTDLEQVSPDSDKKSNEGNEEIEEEVVEDFESPAFEPVIATEAVTQEKNEENQNSNLSEISGLTSQDSQTEKIPEKDETMLSQISSNEKTSIAGMSGEEAQMAPENDVKVKIEPDPPLPMVIEAPQFDLNKDAIEFTGTERKNILLDDSTNSNDVMPVPPLPPPPPMPPQEPMEVDNNFENDTSDSSEMKMEIDIKDESTQESAKVEENSQDSAAQKSIKEKEQKDLKESHHHKHHKRDRSKDRHKSSSSSHKSSSHRHHSKSSSSRHESSSDKHKSRTKSSSSHSKKGTTVSGGDKDKDKERSSSSSHKKSKHRDDHHSSKSRRKSTENEPTTSNVNDEKVHEKMDEKSEDSSSDSKKKSSILMKYDYLKSEVKKSADEIDEEDCHEFLGFAVENVDNGKLNDENPWMKLLQRECERNKRNENRKAERSMNQSQSVGSKLKSKQKSKSPDSLMAITNEESTSSTTATAQEVKIQQQRYETEDLYKPRFDFISRSRRRAQNVEDTVTTTTGESSSEK